MPGHRLELTRAAEARQAAAMRGRFLDELLKTFAPLANCTPLALAYTSPGHVEWLTTCAACPCSQHAPEAVPCFTSGVQGRHICNADVSWDGKFDGSVFLCCDASSKSLETVLRRLV